MTTTSIEWADHVWNPVVGCSIASHGCNNCYAMGMAHRLAAMADAHQDKHGAPGPLAHYQGLTHKAARQGATPVWTGDLAAAPDAIWMMPLKRRKPTTYFVNSMGDLFHPDVPDAWRDKAFAIMALCPQHTFIVLTKRADVMRQYITTEGVDEDGFWFDREHRIACAAESFALDQHIKTHRDDPDFPLANVWLGVTAEDQEQADRRIPDLLATPAAKRLVSVEPMLGPVDLRGLSPSGQGREVNALNGFDTDPGVPGAKLDWVICGGESGKNARPMDPDWARSLRDQCAQSGTAFFFKQWGEHGPVPGEATHPTLRNVTVKYGKKANGHLLDGVAHQELPK
jgi:protein gp37